MKTRIYATPAVEGLKVQTNIAIFACLDLSLNLKLTPLPTRRHAIYNTKKKIVFLTKKAFAPAQFYDEWNMLCCISYLHYPFDVENVVIIPAKPELAYNKLPRIFVGLFELMDRGARGAR